MRERSRRAAVRLSLAVVLGAAAAAGGLACRRETAPTASAVGFVDRAKEAGIDFRMTFLRGEQGERFKINLYDHGAGVSVADYDGDGDDDVYFCNQLGPNALYRNDGSGRFTDVTEAAGVGLADRVSVAAVFGDVDDDGDQDLYVATTRGGNVFFRNRGDGTFEDRTEAAGLSLVAHSQAATFFDADGDGKVDLLVCNTARWTTDVYDDAGKYYVGPDRFFDLVMRSPREANRLYRNRGDGTFEDVTREAGIAGEGWSGDACAFDYDGDGDLDVFVSNMFGRGALYQNDGHGKFRDVAASTLGRMSWATIGARVFDYDDDGLLDLFLVDMHSDMWMDPSFQPDVEGARRKYPSVWGPRADKEAREEALFASTFDAHGEDRVFGNTLFHARGGGRFEETSARAGVESLWPWGIATGDFDGDGFEDAFVPSGMGHPFRYWPSPLFMNDGDGTFTDRAAEAGIDPPPSGRLLEEKIGTRSAARSARAAATADFDGDGRLDIVVNGFNDRALLLMNRWPLRRFVGFRLTGTTSGRDAIGAVVRLKVGGRTMTRQVCSACGYIAQSSRTLHFALGDAGAVDSCEIRWPSGTVQTVPVPALDRVLTVTEPRR